MILIDENHTLKITTPVTLYVRIWLIWSMPSNKRRDFNIVFLYFTIKMTNRMLCHICYHHLFFWLIDVLKVLSLRIVIRSVTEKFFSPYYLAGLMQYMPKSHSQSHLTLGICLGNLFPCPSPPSEGLTSFFCYWSFPPSLF